MSERVSVSEKFNVLTRRKCWWFVILLLILTILTVIFVGESLCRASDHKAYEIRLFQGVESFSGSRSYSGKVQRRTLQETKGYLIFGLQIMKAYGAGRQKYHFFMISISIKQKKLRYKVRIIKK